MESPTLSVPEIERADAELFRLFVVNVVDYALIMLSPSGHITTWNAGAERIKGYTEREIIGKHFTRFYPPEDVAAGKCQRLLDTAEREGHVLDEGWRVRKDGTRFWASVAITAVRDERGRLVGFGKTTRDLTERKIAEEERVKLAQVEEAVRLRDEFLSIASHELKTPLTAVRLQLQNLLESTNDDKLARKASRALRGADRLSELVEALLDVARISTGRFTLRRERLDLHAVVVDSCDRLREHAEIAGATIEVSGDSVEGTWDRLRIEQVVANLVTNAIKYAGPKPVHVTVATDGDHAVITVDDRGPGISEADRVRIFERFERAASMRNYGGLGLGLYVSREITMAHGGDISVENLATGGARFTVRLPRFAERDERPHLESRL